MGDRAFIGFSLDSKLFSRQWVRAAFRHILLLHPGVNVVLGDRLLTFNKAPREDSDGVMIVDLPSCEARIAKRVGDIRHFVSSEISALDAGDRSRVSVSNWDDNVDARFVNIKRILSIAYSSIDRFRECVDGDVEAHLVNQIRTESPLEIHRRVCALYVLEETAMIIRITEFGSPFEYYPQEHIFTLTSLYENKFARYGLTVEGLVGHPKLRRFQPLLLTEIAATFPVASTADGGLG